MSRGFRDRLRAGELLVGTFLKTPSPVVAELLGLSGLDCVVIDGEHAPFDRGSLDGCLMALHGAGVPALVRVPSPDGSHVLPALDGGGVGVVVPHVRHAEDARAAVRAAHYGPGGRGFAAAPRGAAYGGRSLRQQLSHAAETTTVIVQIEDLEALDNLPAIMATPGLDGVVVGRMDLTVSLGADSPSDPRVLQAVDTIVAAARAASLAAGMFVPLVSELPRWRAQGITLFLLGSDQQFVLEGARSLARAARSEAQAADG